MDKKKLVDPSNKDCAYCESSGAKLTCANCKAAHYCSKACQKQHWKNGHKERCIAPGKRRPQAMDTNPQAVGSLAEDDGGGSERSQCPICLEFLSDTTVCTLPCEHEFHQHCVEELRKHGVLNACPLCRADLPAGPERLYDDAVRVFVKLGLKVDCGKASWQSLTPPQKAAITEARTMLTMAANQGFARAQYLLGSMAHFGHGVAQDYHESVRWTRKAADQGLASSQFGLGTMYRDGKGVSQDRKEAARWFRKAAAQGLAEAQFNLGAMYRDGQGVSQDHKEAAQWIQKAAKQGLMGAQCELGTMYQHGKGVAQDSGEAARWTKKAADQDDADAQFHLSLMYRYGHGVAQDYKEQVRWARKSANQGHPQPKSSLPNSIWQAQKLPKTTPRRRNGLRKQQIKA